MQMRNGLRVLLFGGYATLAACTPEGKFDLRLTVDTVCASQDAAQFFIDSALKENDRQKATDVVNFVKAMCPAIQVSLPPEPPKTI